MLISLFALLAMALSVGFRWLMANVPINIEGPATLELALIGIGVIAVYAVATRRLWPRPPIAREHHWSDQQTRQHPMPPVAKEASADKPRRGAA